MDGLIGRKGIVLCASSLIAIGSGAMASSTGSVPPIHVCTELVSITKGVSPKACLWHKHHLTVQFLDGDPVVEQKVKAHAMEWTQYSGVEFIFVDGEVDSTPPADIRISFDPKGGSWSYIGQCQPVLEPTHATMNFGWLTPDTPDSEYERVVLHEFGHALGLGHEHEHPLADIPWNKPAVYAYYERTEGWDKSKIDANIFATFSPADTIFSSYDPNSIMEYPIPRELTLNGFEVGWNYGLSEEDKRFIHQLYAEE